MLLTNMFIIQELDSVIKIIRKLKKNPAFWYVQGEEGKFWS